MDWPTYAEQRILRPLGMVGATYRERYPAELAKARDLPRAVSSDVAARITLGWRWHEGKFVPTPYKYVSHVASAGSLSMSAHDAALYMRALLDPSLIARAGVLRADTLNTMRQPLFSDWSWFRWLRVAAAILVFAALSLTLWQHGLLGYSGWA